jgi:hypothetical protein
MVVGKVAEWMGRLKKGEAVVISRADMEDSAKAYMTSMLFDRMRDEYVSAVAAEVESDQYPEFALWERPDGRWTLDRR